MLAREGTAPERDQANDTDAAPWLTSTSPEKTKEAAKKAADTDQLDSIRNTRRDRGAASALSDSHQERARTPDWVAPAQFAEMVLDDNEELALLHFQKLRVAGIADEILLLDLLAPTSIELGRRWEQDLSDFAEVTIGVCRLHRLLRALHPQHNRRLDTQAHGGRVALAPAPGEQHSFGLLLVGELLFRAGWYTDVDIDSDSDQLNQTVAQNWYEMAGISVSCESRLQSTAELIASVRKNSCNPDVAIIVGGRVFDENRQLGFEIGADEVITREADITAIAAKYVPRARRI
jgi:methanogenic corrinoid protein MtbC1